MHVHSDEEIIINTMLENGKWILSSGVKELVRLFRVAPRSS